MIWYKKLTYKGRDTVAFVVLKKTYEPCFSLYRDVNRISNCYEPLRIKRTFVHLIVRNEPLIRWGGLWMVITSSIKMAIKEVYTSTFAFIQIQGKNWVTEWGKMEWFANWWVWFSSVCVWIFKVNGHLLMIMFRGKIPVKNWKNPGSFLSRFLSLLTGLRTERKLKNLVELS